MPTGDFEDDPVQHRLRQPHSPTAATRPRLHRTTTIGRRARGGLAARRESAELARCLALLAAGHLPCDDDDDDDADADDEGEVDDHRQSIDSGYTSDESSASPAVTASASRAGKLGRDEQVRPAVKKVSFADEKGWNLVDVRTFWATKAVENGDFEYNDYECDFDEINEAISRIQSLHLSPKFR